MNWKPTVESGLHGERYLSETIENVGLTPSEAHAPGVYALELCVPDPHTEAMVAQAWKSVHDVLPPFFDRLVEAERYIYVGAAKDVFDRIEDHLASQTRTSAVCEAFPVHSVFDVWLSESVDKAFEEETNRAIQLGYAMPNCYVHSR